MHPHTMSVAIAMEHARHERALTRRERDVVRGIALGYSTRELAGRLYLSERTVKEYRARAGRKIGSSTRPAITRYALNHRLIS